MAPKAAAPKAAYGHVKMRPLAFAICCALCCCVSAASVTGGLRVGLLTQVFVPPPPPPSSMNLHLLLPLHRNETQCPLLWLVTPSQWPPIKGLYRDAECVAWALQSLPLALKPTKNAIAHLSAFVVPALYDADNHTLSVHYFKKEWVHVPGNPDPIAHISQSEEVSAVLSRLPPQPSVQHSVLEWYLPLSLYTSMQSTTDSPPPAGVQRCTCSSCSRQPSPTSRTCARA
jgi:hypothetical protein